MPQINRIRIINFSYNNHNRHIVDETFDFYQGENALLSLKNGGGKSVLVQLLLQPIIPKTKLMNRKIEDFFKGKKTPSYIMIEWKLDDQGGYLLTGIGMANRETQVREQDEANNSLKYFTFTSNYHEANLFDIENIPLVKKSDEKIYIEEFKNAKKLISAKEKNVNFSIRLFTDEDKLEYKKHLSSYNISQDEWKSIILKINESEGGVIEIFERCKTSQQLMNDWILKSIEKVVNKEDRDQRKLEQMLENLVEEMISNEQFIYEKEVYQEFLKKSDEYLDKLNSLVSSLDNEKKLENNIAKMYYYLKYEINKMVKEINLQSEKVSNSEKELKKIDLEERSKEYYEILDRVNNLEKLTQEEEKKLDLINEEIGLNKKEELIEQAARDYAHIKRLKRLLAGINEEIEKIKNSDESKEKIRNLEYSLKIAYERVIEQLNEKLVDVNNQLDKINNSFHSYEMKTKILENESNKLQNKIGGIRNEIEAFEKYEERIRKDLNLTYTRNLLGEIEEDYKNNYLNVLDKKIVDLSNEKENIGIEIEKSRNKAIEIDEKLNKLRGNNEENVIEVTKLNNEIEEYYKKEVLIKPIFDKYDFDWNRRFNHEENQVSIKAKINELQKKERDIDLNVRTINENINSLKNGTLHVSKEFRELLINKDIAFETGENYLRKQSTSIRNDLIKHNPILPFAFLLYDEDIELLKKVDIGLSIHQMVPIISYKDIKHKYAAESNFVQIEDKLQFLCLYDDKMIDADNLDLYLEELNKELDEGKEQLTHYRGELERTREDLQILKNFDYNKNYIYEIEKRNENVEKQKYKIRQEIKELESEKENTVLKIDEYRDRINLIEKQLSETREDIQKFNEFKKEDENYLQNKCLSKSCLDTIENIDKEKEIVKNEIDKLSKDKEDNNKQKISLEYKIKGMKNKFLAYENAEEGTIIDDDIDNMEERLQVLKNKITSDLKYLESEQNVSQLELKNKQDELKSYNLEEREYIDRIYDSEHLKMIQEKIRKLEEEKESINASYIDLKGKLQKLQGRLESAEEEVKKLGEKPLDLSLIKMNFNERRKEEKESIVRAKDKIIEFNKISKNYDKLVSKIEEQVEVNKYEVNIDCEIIESVNKDYEKLTKDLKHLKQENVQYEKNVNNHYYNLKANYENKNKYIENIFKGLEPLISGAQADKDKYYYLGERMLINNESLNKLIRACEQRLSNVEKNKNDMIQHSYLHAKQVYDEIQKIAENSSITLEGKSRPIPMIKIDMVPLDEIEEENKVKMSGYIENCVNIIKEDMKQNKKIEDIGKKISKYMSTRELLNVLSDLGKMRIFAYKIDINVKNSRYKTWEQVMKENSGGERFVSFFAVLVALMSYTRTSMKFQDDYQRNKDTKVLIMDNPFGPISSEHLLKPLFKIAGKYNTQLICFTDLKQNSILNCFDLIYIIKIRQNVFATNEYIQLQEQIKEGVNIQKDEMLEKAVFNAQEVDQISLF